MLLDYAVAYAEPQTGALSHIFRGEEGVENPAAQIVGDTPAVVGETYPYVVAQLVGRDMEVSVAPGRQGGMLGVDDDVQEHLLQLMLVRQHPGKVLIDVQGYVDVAAGEVVSLQRHGLFNRRRYIQAFPLRLVLSSKGKQVID